MKKLLRKALAIVCALAFAVTGITYSPSETNADTQWFNAISDWTHYMTDVNTSGDHAGIWDYTEAPAINSQYKNGDSIEGFSWKVTKAGEAVWLKVPNLKDINCVTEGSQKVKPQAGVMYKLNMKVTYSYDGTATNPGTTAIQLWSKNGNAPALFERHLDALPNNNTIEVKDAEIMPEANNNLSLEMGIGVKEIYAGWGGITVPCTVTITEFSLVRADDFEDCVMVIDPDDPDHPYGSFTPPGTPWKVSTQYDASKQLWGKMSYKIDGTASDVTSTYLRADNPAHDDETEGVDQSDPEKWWWWNGCRLEDYLSDVANLQTGYKYKGTLKIDYTKPSSSSYANPKIRMIINGEVVIKELSSGINTISIGGDEGFLYDGTNNTIQFNVDLLDKGGIMRISELSFTRADNFEPVTPNVQGGFNPTGTPWYYSVVYDPQYDPDTQTWSGSWGAMSYMVEGDPAELGSTTVREDTPAHDDTNDKLKTDTLKGKKRDEYPDMSQAEFEAWWDAYDATQDPEAWWWWNSGKLKGYMSSLVKDKKYTGKLTYTYTAPTNVDPKDVISPQLRMVYGGESEIIDITPGTHTIDFAAGGFRYDGEHSDVDFNFDLLEKGGIINISAVEFKDDGFDPVPAQEGGFVPKNSTGTISTPWTITVSNNGSTAWGMMSYDVDDNNAAAIGGTTMRNDNPAHDDTNAKLKSDALKQRKRELYPEKTDAQFEEWWADYDATEDPDAWWWWNSAKLENYMTTAKDDKGNALEDGKTYSSTLNINYTPSSNPEDDYDGKIRILLNGDVHIVELSPGPNEIKIDPFDYSDSYPNVEFNLDLMGKNSTFQVTDITFKLENSDWTRVTDNTDPGALIQVSYDDVVPNVDTTTHTWNLFAGIWEGKGCKLYYKKDQSDPYGPLSVKIGDGERWDPACAQIKLSNTDAYQGLVQGTHYYMTYTFYSTEEGTLHINQENYDPEGLERVDVHKGWNTYTKYVPYYDKLNPGANLTMFLTPTTYEYDPDYINPDASGPDDPTYHVKVVKDGEYLPKGTILSDFKVSLSRQDALGWTLVRDSRHPDPEIQGYDTLVEDADENPLLLAYTNSSIPRCGRMSYLANQNPDGEDDIAKMGIRLDSTGYGEDDMYEFQADDWGNHLRIPNSYFYDRTDTNGNPLKAGKKYKLRFYYNSTGATLQDDEHGLIMVRQGYDENRYFMYPGKVGLNMANGTITKTNKNGYVSHEDTDTVTYTKTGGIDFYYNPEKTVDDQYVQFDFSYFPSGTYINDISWEFYAPGYNVFIDNVKNNTQPITDDEGQNTYTFPDNTVQGFEDVVKYVDANDPQKEYAPGQTITFEDFNDADIYVNTVREHTVEIRSGSTTGQLIQSDTVGHNEMYTLPTISGVVNYTFNGQTLNAGQQIGPIIQDEIVVANLQNAHLVTYVDANDPTHEYDTDTVIHGNTYTLHDLTGVDVDHYEYNGQTYQPGQSIGTVTDDVTVKVYLKAAEHTVKYVNKDDHDICYYTDTAYEGTNYSVQELTTVNVDKYYYEGVEKQPGDDLGNITQDIEIEVTLVPAQHTVIYRNKYDTSITYLTDYVDHGDRYDVVPLPGVNVDHYEYGSLTNLHVGDSIGAVNENIVIDVVLSYTITYVDKDNHSIEYDSTTVPQGEKLTLPDSIDNVPAEDLDKYVYENVDKHPGDQIGPFTGDTIVEVVKVPQYTVSIDGVPYKTVRDGGNCTLPASTGIYEGVIGYIYDQGRQQTAKEKVVDPESTVGPIHENRNYISIKSISLVAEQGASMWFKAGQNMRGIGFGAQFTIFDKDGNAISRYDHPMLYKSESFQLGTLITPYDIYTEVLEGDLDLSSMEKAAAAGYPGTVKKIENDYSFCDPESPDRKYGTYRAGIINMADTNITRDFTARSYGFIVTSSGAKTDVVYGDMTPKSSIKYIATVIKNTPEEYAKYTKDYQREVIEYCVNYEG